MTNSRPREGPLPSEELEQEAEQSAQDTQRPETTDGHTLPGSEEDPVEDAGGNDRGTGLPGAMLPPD